MITDRRRTSFALAVLSAFFCLGILPGSAGAQVSALPLNFGDVAIFATNSARIDNGAQVTSGHVVVNNASPGPTLSPGFELAISNNAHTPTGYAVVADSIKVSSGAVVGGNAFFNTLSNSGTINGTQNTPLALPVFTPLPTFKSAPPGTADVTVPSGTVQTLAAGNYRDITVQSNATLRLDQGITNVRSITVSNGGKLLFLNLASGPSEVRVSDTMNIGNNFVVGPVDSDPLKAKKIVFYVASASMTTVAVDTGNGGTLYANVYAPNGTLILDNNTNAAGAFLAKDVDVQNGTTVALESFFTTVPPAFTSADSTTFTVLQSNSFTVTVTGAPTPTITQSGTLPSGVNFMDNGDGTATLSGIPASGTVGTYPITFMASNTAGSANQNFTLTVIKASQTITFTSTAPSGAMVGGPTYNVTATATSGLAVSFTIDGSASSVCTISGSTVSFIGAGTCVINANQPGNGDYNAAPQAQQSFAVAKGNQTITFTSTAPSDASYQGPTYTVTATASSGLTVTFTIDASATSVCSITGSTVSFIGTGTCVINANQAGNANYNPAPQVQQSFPVAKANQTITFTSSPPAQPTVGGPTYTVTATATSGLTVTFTIDGSASSVCSISGGNVVSFIGNGTCVINANQAGDANYNPAPQVQQSFTVKSAQTITFTSTPPAQPTVGGPTYTVTATATSGLTVTFTIDGSASGVCSISGGNVVSFIGAGTCVINANQAGNANFYPAPQVQQSFGVKNAQTITFTSTAPAAAVYQGPTYTVTATASSGLTVTFTIAGSASGVCSISGGNVVSFIGTGTCVINANQAGNATFYPAPQVQQSFSVGPNLADNAYSVVGNTQLVAAGHSAPTTPFTADATSLLANDTSDVAITVTTVTNAPTTGGGSITIDAAGAFTYTPPVGQSSGTDTYVYTGTSNGVSRTATITFNIANIVWYVDNTSTGTHDGRSNTPFTNMGSGANGLGTALAGSGPAAGAYIYVSKGSGDTTGAYTFKANQSLIGAGATLTVGTLTVPGNAANTPTLSGTLSATSVSGLTVNGLSMSTGSATAVNFATVGGTFTFTAISANGCGTAILVDTLSSGSFTVNGTGTTAGSGGTIQNCTVRGADFRSASNVTLKNMDFIGNGTAGAGVLPTACANALTQSLGPVPAGCQANVYLQAVSAVVLDNVKANQSKAVGIWGNGLNGLTLTNVEARGNGDEVGEDGVQLVNQQGTVTVTGGTFKDNAARSFEVQNNSGSATVNITGAVFGNTLNPTAGTTPSTATAADTILLATNGTNSASITSVIKGSSFNNIFGRALNVNTEGNTSQNVSFGQSGAGNGNAVTNVSFGTDVNGTTSGNVTYSVVNNTFSNVAGAVTAGARTLINARMGLGATGTWSGTVSDNTIGTNGVPASGCDAVTCGGISTDTAAIAGLHDVVITGNNIFRVRGNGIFVGLVSGVASTATMRTRIEDNDLQDPEDGTTGAGGNQGSGVLASTVGSGAVLNIKAGGVPAAEKNNVVGNWNTAGGGTLRGIRFSRGNGTTFCVSGFSGPFDSTSVATYITSQNTGNAGSATQPAGQTGFSGPTCPTP
jgi:hypothetical protein